MSFVNTVFGRTSGYFGAVEKQGNIVVNNRKPMFNLNTQDYRSLVWIMIEEVPSMDKTKTKVVLPKAIFKNSIFVKTEFSKFYEHHVRTDIPAKKLRLAIRVARRITQNNYKNVELRYVGVGYSGMAFSNSYLGNTVGIPILKTKKILKPDEALEQEIMGKLTKKTKNVYEGYHAKNILELMIEYKCNVWYQTSQSTPRDFFYYFDIRENIQNAHQQETFVKILRKFKSLRDKNVDYIILPTESFFVKVQELNKYFNEILNIVLGKDIKEFNRHHELAAKVSKTNILSDFDSKTSDMSGAPFDHQKEGISWLYGLYQKKVPGAILADDMGMGKALAENTSVKIPGGWKAIKDLQVLDQVIGRDGNPTNVTGVYPQGIRETFKIIFDDGREVIADKDHLWQIHSYAFTGVNNLTSKLNKPRVLNTEEIFEFYENKPKERYKSNSKYYIPLCESEIKDDIDLPMDPYLMGLMIGDGGFSQKSASFSSADQEIIEEIRNIFNNDNRLNIMQIEPTRHDKYSYRITRKEEFRKPGNKNEMVSILTENSLMGKKAHVKEIPEIYLEGSRDQKLLLIQGLMDTDGTVHGNVPSFCTTSPKLADQFQQLIWGIGGVANRAKRQGRLYEDGKRIKETLPYYIINIRLKNPNELFKLQRKKDKCSVGQYSKGLMLGISKIEKYQDQKTVCIAVDNKDKLFVIQNHIVTHNTFQTIGFLTTVNKTKAIKRIVIVCPASVISVWQREIHQFNKKLESKVEIFSFEAFVNRRDTGKVDVLVIDEAQRAKNKDTRANEKLRSIESDFVLLLTGTPIENKVQDIYNIMAIIDPIYFKIYNTLQGLGKDENALAAKTQTLLQPVYLRRVKTKKQLKATLQIEEVMIPMFKFEKETHEAILNFYGNSVVKLNARKGIEYYNQFIIALGRLRQTSSYAHQIKDLPFLSGINIEPKASKGKKLLELVGSKPKEKFVIFSMFTETIKHLKSILPEKPLVIDGSVGSHKRGDIIKEFQEGPSRFIIVSLKAGNSGITLHAARNIVMYDLWWNPAVMMQAISRVYRIGQTRDVTAYLFVNKESIDENIIRIINLKKEIIAAFDGKSSSKQQNNTIDALVQDVFK